MLVRAIRKDTNGCSEWCFGHSFGDYKNDLSQVAQDIYTALNEWKYDCFFALENGIDWHTRMGKKGQKELLDTDVINTIQNRVGVLSVYDFISSLNERNYVCTCSVFTEYSEQPLTIDFTI